MYLLEIVLNSLFYKYNFPAKFILNLLPVFIGGGVVGYLAKTKRWLYAAVSSLLLSLIFLALNAIGYFSPLKTLALQTMEGNLIRLPINALVSMFGGYCAKIIFGKKS